MATNKKSKRPTKKKTAVLKAQAKKASVKSKITAKTKSKSKPALKAKGKTSATKTKMAGRSTAVSKVTHRPKSIGGAWDAIFVPLDDRILIRVEGRSEKTAGGIYLPATVEDRPNRGIVLSVGRGHRDSKGRLRPLDVKTGDEVLFADFAGTKTLIQGEELLILRESEILGVVS